MACPFCYVPFDGLAGDRNEALAVLRKILSWETESITFGGGDPLMYDYLEDLLLAGREESRRPLFIQLDTNLLNCDVERLIGMAPYVDLLGLPLDALSLDVCRRMRVRGTHGKAVERLLPILSRSFGAVKVNTVVSRQNLSEIRSVGHAVVRGGAKAWSLYEFWPIGAFARRSKGRYAVLPEEFTSIFDQMSCELPQLRVENGAVCDRANAYFFVTQTGRAYTVDVQNTGEYVELGNILSEAPLVLNEWSRHVDLSANRARFLQRSLVD
jgi:pyruvate-formate lyase-activating enzyme